MRAVRGQRKGAGRLRDGYDFIGDVDDGAARDKAWVRVDAIDDITHADAAVARKQGDPGDVGIDDYPVTRAVGEQGDDAGFHASRMEHRQRIGDISAVRAPLGNSERLIADHDDADALRRVAVCGNGVPYRAVVDEIGFGQNRDPIIRLTDSPGTYRVVDGDCNRIGRSTESV